ncbi:hypothetical protein LRH25_06625 [Ideonella azotifigens]|uniref:DUF3047 domain-containing protein n=1 Tax=Ideonella azotifigens TaxID=513160 RepID=A0ABN1JQ25_9BURK|nr:hypothetical protein [Ideonella azotifigens]MCD2340014.1 hypothetical protein [Ideonella azotifigens]
MTPPQLRGGCVALAMLAGPAMAATDWPEVPAPPRAKVEWVAQDSVINGLPSRIERFETDLSPGEVLSFYRERWKSARAGAPRETAAGGWQGLSTLTGDFQVAVQVKPRQPSGSEGLISTAHFGDVRREPIPSQLPRFYDTRIAQVTESVDGPTRSQLVTMVSNESFEVNMNRWRGEWQRRGWQAAFDKQAPVERDGVRTWLASFNKGSQSVDVALSWRPSDRRSYLTVNLLSSTGDLQP